MNSPEVIGLSQAFPLAPNNKYASLQSKIELNPIETIADKIASDLQPRSVLEVGGANSLLLVQALRQQAVEAFGLNVSENPEQNISPDTQPYCWVGSLTDPFPRKYDLIICLGALEGLSLPDTEQIIKNFCDHSSEVLFSPTRLDDEKLFYPTDHALESWVELFARYDFFHDLDFTASLAAPWPIRFCQATEAAAQVIAAYERRLWQLERENQARRELNIEQRNELATVAMQIAEVQSLRAQLKAWEKRWTQLEESSGWRLVQSLQGWRARLAPPDSVRDQALDDFLRGLHGWNRQLLVRAFQRVARDISYRLRILFWWKMRRLIVTLPMQNRTFQVGEIQPPAPIHPHQATVDIIICVHNALTDVQQCLESVLRYTSTPYSLILIDDGSDQDTCHFLAQFAQDHGFTLHRNETAQGYTLAANQGLRRTVADYVVLLNSDTVVTAGWLDRLIACAESNPRIGLVGPVSNTASWQSIPEVDSEGDWAANPLPPGLTIEEMGQLVGRYSARLYPTMPFLNGFCLLVRRQVIQEIGYFDEENFGAGYGEENDYALRARKAGWLLALADDAYIYHAQSRSYSTPARKRLSERANIVLAKKHDHWTISEGVALCRHDRVLEGIRARSRVMFARQECIQQGRQKFAGRRILFVLPIFQAGGGGNVVIDEALAMRKMGVEVSIYNLTSLRNKFERAYPGLEIPVVYGSQRELVNLASQYDAVIATFNASVEWLASIESQNGRPVRGYYVQDFEPYLYPPETAGFERAWASYTLFPDLVRFTKTEWTRQEVKEQIGVECQVVGASLNIDLFRPRPRPGPGWPDRPLKIVAMVRPSSAYRAPKLTMELLRRAAQHYRASVEITIFGVTLDDPSFAKLPRNFAWKLAGVLNPQRVASLLNEADIFTDFSSHQAMGLTALEAMACGAAVIVPAQGGTDSFARHEANSLVIDTSSPEACWHALQRLIEEHELRLRLQKKALFDVCNFFPERAALNILNALFDPGVSGT